MVEQRLDAVWAALRAMDVVEVAAGLSRGMQSSHLCHRTAQLRSGGYASLLLMPVEIFGIQPGFHP